MQIPIKARWESAVEAFQAVTEQESLFDTFLLCDTKNAKRERRPIIYALSSDFLSKRPVHVIDLANIRP